MIMMMMIIMLLLLLLVVLPEPGVEPIHKVVVPCALLSTLLRELALQPLRPRCGNGVVVAPPHRLLLQLRAVVVVVALLLL
jgi:hypothetical protein